MPISVKSPRSLAGLAPALRALVRAAFKAERRTAGEVGLALADDALLRALNRDYRGLDKATDVLSFGYDGSGKSLPPALPVDGDLVISMDRVHAQARRFRVTAGEELARLVVHGALHLAGLDHQSPAERKLMRAREDAVLRAAAPRVRDLSRRLKAAGA